MLILRIIISIQLCVVSLCFQTTGKPFSRRQNLVHLGATKASSATSRRKRVASLKDWSKLVEIQVTNNIDLQEDTMSGLGWFSGPSSILPSSSVLLTVPADIALTVESPGPGPDDSSAARLIKNELNDLPWYIQMAVYLHKLDRIDSRKKDLDYRPWLDSLPRRLDTPIHWSSLSELQYDYMERAVQRQEKDWKHYYNQLISQVPNLEWESFLWAAEMARSRAFSGAYTGSAFNPLIFAFTLLLVTVYVGLGLGTLEQAANGAGVVVCASVLKDFVLPKLSKTKRYVICPMIDMTNHQSVLSQAEVSFEYFGNAYSLAVSSSATVAAGQQVYISYGTRSNDQLLQYYGFVEPDNPHDVYVMPPLRAWDIAALEVACGRKFADGRLVRLDRAGLLGGTDTAGDNDDMSATRPSSNIEVANQDGGVVVTRVAGIDPAVMQALRALVSTEQEWKDAGEAVGNFSQKISDENEACARAAARKAIEMELASKPTTMDQDLGFLKKMQALQSLDAGVEDRLAVQFRIEKKKVLMSALSMLS